MGLGCFLRGRKRKRDIVNPRRPEVLGERGPALHERERGPGLL